MHTTSTAKLPWKKNQADISVEIIEQPEEYAKIILAKEKLIIHQKMPIYTT